MACSLGQCSVDQRPSCAALHSPNDVIKYEWRLRIPCQSTYIYWLIFAFPIDRQGSDAFKMNSTITPMHPVTSYVEEEV